MTNILRIDGSIRVDSRSRMLADYLLEQLGVAHSDHQVVARNVGMDMPTPPSDEFVNANHTPPADRTAAQQRVLASSDALIDELLAAQLVVVSTPMYNFHVGAGVKSWVDNLIRKDRTFRLTEHGIERLAEDKRMVVICTRGLSYHPASPFASCDHVTPWFRDIFGFIGFDNIDFVTADDLDFAGPEAAQTSIANAKQQLASIAKTFG